VQHIKGTKFSSHSTTAEHVALHYATSTIPLLLPIPQAQVFSTALLLSNTIRLHVVALRPDAGHGLLILEVSTSHTHTHRYTTVGRTLLDE